MDTICLIRMNVRQNNDFVTTLWQHKVLMYTSRTVNAVISDLS